jgi:hypothetical protein
VAARRWNLFLQMLGAMFQRRRADGFAQAESCLPCEADNPARRLELAAFSILIVAYLLPVWLFRYVPTQDGPSHLANAVIVRDYGAPGTRHDEFFEVVYDTFPNWTSHLLLANLSRLMPPLIAEKALLTCCIGGFAFACRFFLAAWPGASALAPLGLLFVFNRCLFMGFYNYCLTLPLVLLILGLCVRLAGRPSPWSLAGLTGLFVLAYFTHLVGYAVAVLGGVLLCLCLPGPRRIRLLVVVVAVLPSAALLIDYLASTGMSTSSIAGSVSRNVGRSLSSWAEFKRFWNGMENLKRDLFNPHEGRALSMASWWLLLYALVAIAELYSWLFPKSGVGPSLKCRLPVLIFGIVMTVLYLSLPDDFGRHGSILKPRLALWLPLLWLALLRLPAISWIRYPVLVGIYGVATLHLAGTCSHFAAANRKLAEYTAATETFGRDHVLYVVQTTSPGSPNAANYLLHACNYYCIDSGSTNLDNYEAGTHYFPVRYRPGVSRGRGRFVEDFESYTSRLAVDLVLMWDCSPQRVAPPDDFRMKHQSPCLRLFERRK